MNTEQERADFEEWALKERIAYRDRQYGVCFYNGQRNAYWIGYQAGRAALQSQDREDAEWMTCESRRPYVVNSLKHIAKELRDAERRSRNTFKKGYMGEPARYFADACGEAAALFEAKLEAIDHARRVKENKT